MNMANLITFWQIYSKKEMMMLNSLPPGNIPMIVSLVMIQWIDWYLRKTRWNWRTSYFVSCERGYWGMMLVVYRFNCMFGADIWWLLRFMNWLLFKVSACTAWFAVVVVVVILTLLCVPICFGIRPEEQLFQTIDGRLEEDIEKIRTKDS